MGYPSSSRPHSRDPSLPGRPSPSITSTWTSTMPSLLRLARRLARFIRTSPNVRPALRLEPLEDRTVPTLLGQQLFPADSPWNQLVTNAPVAANSAAVLNNIITQSNGDGRLHPDFGQDYHAGNPLYGIPYNVVHGNTTTKI